MVDQGEEHVAGVLPPPPKEALQIRQRNTLQVYCPPPEGQVQQTKEDFSRGAFPPEE